MYEESKGYNATEGRKPTDPQLGFQIVDKECQMKPTINEISKILAQNKRTGQPVHERLHK